MVNKKRKSRPQKKTLVFVGEGETEKAFLQHLKSIYGVGALKVTAKSAGGKGPGNVIGDALGTMENAGCDKVAVLLDTDLPWPPGLVKEANKAQITLIGSTPCLEGFLLTILTQPHPTPSDNKTCKKRLHPQLCGKSTEKESYHTLFTKTMLNKAATSNKDLKLIIDLISGKD